MHSNKSSDDGVEKNTPSNNSIQKKKNKNKKNSTLKDLEKATGVSKSTISRVFNNPEKVKSSTLKLVKEKADELGYQPSRVAQRLQAGQGKAKVIGLIIPDIMNPFFAEITRGIEDVALKNGYALILNNSNENLERQQLCLDTLRMEGVDGIILPPVIEDDEYVKDLIENGLNIVCIDRVIKGAAVDSILSDNRKGAYIAVSHLIELGHHRIAYIGGIPSISTTKERLNGYREAFDDHDITVDEDLIFIGDSKQESGERLTEQLLKIENPPTAIFTGNNMTTLGAYVALNRLKVSVPNEIALVGYDDVPWAAALNPPPTVVDQSAYEIGRRSAEMLLSRIKNPESSTVKLMLEPKFLVRESCGAKMKNRV
ncbi:MAG TPA: LacI family DNA-binding transcriptional regulator [Balneolaceae bacterium]|nr:LacI family DNA-binding transcriptional regulator [Balneolaceae bacterium]